MNHSISLEKIKFVDAHDSVWANIAFSMTRDYFVWMNDEIEKTCSLSISDLVGIPLEQYIKIAANDVCPKDQPHAKYYLLVDGNRAMAMGGLRVLPNGDAEVVRIYTKPEYRGRGIGRMIIKRLISDAHQSGFKKLKLDTGVFMKEAQQLYASYGFRLCEPYEGAEPPEALSPYWLYMELDLTTKGCNTKLIQASL